MNERHVRPGVRFAADAYVNYSRVVSKRCISIPLGYPVAVASLPARRNGFGEFGFRTLNAVMYKLLSRSKLNLTIKFHRIQFSPEPEKNCIAGSPKGAITESCG